MPLQDTLAVQRILNEACEKLGVFHTEDSTSQSDRRSFFGTGHYAVLIDLRA